MTRFLAAAFAAALTLAATLNAARAADPIFPPASRIGLAPPQGFVLSKSFAGFENPDSKAAIVIAELPAIAYDEIDKSLSPEGQKGQALVTGGRGTIPLKDGKGFFVVDKQEAGGRTLLRWVLVAQLPNVTAVVTALVPEDAKDKYPDATMKDALATVEARAAVPTEEQLSVLPFALNNLAGFRIARVQPGGAAMLTDGPKDSVEASEQPLLMVSLGADPAAPNEDRGLAARRMFASIPGLKEIRYRRSEPLRIGGQQGFEIVADAKDQKTDAEVTVVQWLRYSPGSAMRMVGMARKDSWPSVFPRFRAVRDGIEPK